MESRKSSQSPGSNPGLGGQADSVPPLELLSINDLARCCSEETNKFLKQSVSNDRYCLELFRHAITRRDDDAWACIYQQYAPLVLTWVNQHQSAASLRSEEHTSELQSPDHLVCRLLLEKKKKKKI